MTQKATTAIYVRVKRYAETYFILCDEFETVESLKQRLLSQLEQIEFKLERQPADEPLTTDNFVLHLKRRVSCCFLQYILRAKCFK